MSYSDPKPINNLKGKSIVKLNLQRKALHVTKIRTKKPRNNEKENYTV